MNSFGTGYGKLVSPTDLAEFVGSDSWMFFALLEIETEFPQLPVSPWAENDCFKYGVTL